VIALLLLLAIAACLYAHLWPQAVLLVVAAGAVGWAWARANEDTGPGE
jgi:chromate transport protein ChrA